MVLRKDELEVQLKDEHQQIRDGVLKDESPLDDSLEFQKLCDACRIGDLKGCQEAISQGVNINARDSFDYTPLILASLCGHYETVQLLLESGALCERDTFQGERCLYNALTNRIRNLLLQYDYSKSADPLQPLASHITSLLTRQIPKTADICLTAASEQWNLHKFILSARSPYFSKRLVNAPEATAWKLANTVPAEAFQVALRYLYLGDVPSDLGLSGRSFVSEDEVLTGIDKISKQLEIDSLWKGLLAGSDRRLARQRHQDEVARGRNQIEAWYRNNVLKHKIYVESSKVAEVKWTQDNAIFSDILLRADEDNSEEDVKSVVEEESKTRNTLGPLNGIPIGPFRSSRSPSRTRKARQSVLFPAHRAMLLRSEYFQTMFASSFRESQHTEYLQVITVDCHPNVLEIVLDFLYTEQANIPIEIALDVLYVADMLFIEKLKTKATIVISTVGMGGGSITDRNHTELGQETGVEIEQINVYDVIRAGWLLKVRRLEEFGARYLASRLEDYIDEEEFEELIKESASRTENRQETDSIEVLDDIRFYLTERFRLGFEDSGLEDVMEENETVKLDTISDPLPDEGIDMNTTYLHPEDETKYQDFSRPLVDGELRTFGGRIAEDEIAADALNHQYLLEKIDLLLDKLNLDA